MSYHQEKAALYINVGRLSLITIEEFLLRKAGYIRKMEVKQILPEQLSAAPREYSPLALAFIGDAVYELFVRTRVLAEANASAHTLHQKAVTYVKASAQAAAAKKIMDSLSEDELAVFKRGRNTKSSTVPKNADVTDYRYATGYEALLGYLYLSGETARLIELMCVSFDTSVAN